MRVLILLLGLIATGCSREDGTKLANIGRMSAAKVRDAAPERAPWGELNAPTTPADRVRLRLQHDANLVGHRIEVSEEPDGVRLKGTVAQHHQADWAERLARETTGVKRVVNEIRLAD